jgi:hypothetical protein
VRTVDIYEIEIGIGVPDQPRHWLARIGEGVEWEAMRLTRPEALRLCIGLIETVLTDTPEDEGVTAELAMLAKVRSLLRVA